MLASTWGEFRDYLLIAYSKCYFFDKQFHLTDTLKLPIAFEDAQYSGNDTVIVLKNLMNNNAPPTQKEDGVEGFYSFNLVTKELSLYIDTKMINEIVAGLSLQVPSLAWDQTSNV